MPRTRSSIAKKARVDWEGIARLEARSFRENPQYFSGFYEEHLAKRTRVEIEIGSGSGRFLLAAAQAMPHSHFLGIEYTSRFLKHSRDQLHEKRLENVALLCADAKLFVEHGVPDDAIDAFHVYFPDPWPKASQKKRRFLSLPGLSQVARTLKPGGRLYFATDDANYARMVEAGVRETPLLRPAKYQEFGPALQNNGTSYAAYGLTTHYGEKHLRHGKTLYAFELEK